MFSLLGNMEKEELLSPIGKSDMERKIDLLRMDSAGKFRCLQGLSKSPLCAKRLSVMRGGDGQ